MKLALMLNGKPELIEILTAPPACRFRLGEEAVRDALVETPEHGVYSVILDGRSYEAYVDGTAVTVDGHRFEIEVHDPRKWSAKSGRHAGEGVQTVVSPMPGKVVRVLVAVGERVQSGQGLVVVEAMKMQNEMKAPRAGSVINVPAKEGSTVVAGEALVAIE